MSINILSSLAFRLSLAVFELNISISAKVFDETSLSLLYKCDWLETG